MPLSVTYSILVAIWFQPATIEISEQVRLEIGRQQWPEAGGHVLIGPQKLTCQYHFSASTWLAVDFVRTNYERWYKFVALGYILAGIVFLVFLLLSFRNTTTTS